MKPVKGYTEAKATNFNAAKRLPIGGYILKILDVKEEHNQWGDVIILRFDIAEGEYKNFFDEQYRSMSDEFKKWKGTYRINIPEPKGNTEDDQKKYNRFVGFYKSQIEAFENSNNIKIDASKEWDINVLKNKLVGAVFGNKEWEIDGRTGWYTNCDHLISVQDIRDGNFKIPADKPVKLKNKPESFDISEFEELNGLDSESPVPF